MPSEDFHATTAVPSLATATCGSVATSSAGDSAFALPQRPDARQVAAITRPRLDHAAVTAERPSTPITGFALPRPGMRNATALPNAAPASADATRAVSPAAQAGGAEPRAAWRRPPGPGSPSRPRRP